MRVEYAFLARAAEMQKGNSWAVLGGGLDHFHAQAFPHLISQLNVVVGLRLDPHEARPECVCVGPRVRTPDGKVSPDMAKPPVWGGVPVPAAPTCGGPADSFVFIMAIQRFAAPMPGRYELILEIQGAESVTLVFDVVGPGGKDRGKPLDH
jgi:hypothetical protein